LPFPYQLILLLAPDLLHNRIPIICAGWAKEFPSLPSWPTFISRISAAPQPYRRLIPQFNGEIVLSDREEYTRALYWLISHDLVVQAHDHVKIVATKATKQKARKELDRERTLKRLAKERDPTGRRASVPESLMGDRSKVANETESIVETASTDDSLDISEEDFDESKLGEEFLNDPQESFIHKPKKPSSAENRCLKIIMRDKDLEWQRRFAQYVSCRNPAFLFSLSASFSRCLTCFDGKMTLDAMQYETGLRRNYIRDLLTVFKEDVSAISKEPSQLPDLTAISWHSSSCFSILDVSNACMTLVGSLRLAL
jgi:hypothetical protein